MTTQEELLQKRIRELEKEVAHLHSQIKHQQYGLVWLDVPEAFDEESENKIPILEEVPELAIHHDDGKPTHILIEGDNYHALTCLNYTHKGKVDVIYIDPPYNTGSDGFTYKDKRLLEQFPDGTLIPSNHPLRHSCWLSFMRKRLSLAKDLMSDRGLIFISIDDNEQSNLKLLCDEVFGKDNFVATYFWKRTETPPALSYKVRRKLEYVLCYTNKNLSQRIFAQGYVDGGDAPLLNSGNPLGIINFPVGCVHFNIADGIYRASSDKKINLLDDVIVERGLNKNSFRAQAHFKWQQTNLEEEVANGTFFIIKSSQFSIRYQKSTKSTKVPSNIIDSEVGVGTNETANKELKELGFNGNFEYAKPTSLVKFLTKMGFWAKNDIVVLDFFAGSGTTLDAIIQLNADENYHQCILCQINEANICTEVTYERNKRVMNGYTDSKGNHVEGLGNSLKYYRTAFVGKNKPKEATDEDKLTLSKKAGCLLALAENTLYEQKSTDFYQIYSDEKGRSTAIYFQEDGAAYDEFLKDVEHINGKRTVYIFSWGTADEFRSDFEMMKDVTVKSIPQPILDIYKSLNQ